MTDTIQAPTGAGRPPAPRRPGPAVIGPVDAVRLAWRRLRRMSTALLLLFSLAVASVIGTLVPQEPVIAPTVAEWRAGVDAAGDPVGPGAAVAGVLDALGFFDVFGSWWFLTLVTLLFVSLTGCLLPRYRAFAKVVRRPPAAGRNLDRLSSRAVLATDLGPDDALAAADRVMSARHWRRRLLAAADSPTGSGQLAAERGHWREGGSLVFHTAFYVLLIGVFVGQLWGFTGQVNLVEGGSFVDTRLSYEGVNAGRLFGLDDHRAFRVTLDDFAVSYHPNGVESDFVSAVTLDDGAGTGDRQEVRVNHPALFAGTKLYQLRWGMAPHVVIRPAGGRGDPFYERSVLLGAGPGWTWNGVERVFAGGRWDDGSGEPRELPQMALDLALVPDAGDRDGQVVSRTPRPENPVLFANLYLGDLGLDRNVPASALVPGWGPQQVADQVALRPGEPVAVLGGAFEMELVGVDQWSGFQVSRQPGRELLLAAGVLVLAGLVPSLYSYRRRLWVTARPGDGGTEVVLAGTALQRREAFDEEFTGIAADLRRALTTPTDTPAEGNH